MNDGWVKSVDEERDLVVLMFTDFMFSKQCLLGKNKANLMLCIINRGLSYKSAEVISKLYRSHPILDTNKCERCRYASGGTEKSNQNDSKFEKLIIRGERLKGWVCFL